MANTSNTIKKRLIGEVLSETELENIMAEYQYSPIYDETDNILKFTNYSSQIWVVVEHDQENNLLITDTKYVTKVKDVSTKVDPFHTFEDMKKVLDYFINNEQSHHWLCSCLMVSFGRRVGDTMSLKWCDLYTANGKFRKRLVTLKEEKTGKNNGVRLHGFVQECIEEYCELANIKPLEHYKEKIFSIGTAAYRAALKKAVQEVGLDYEVSTHSFRKFYGNMMYKLHPQDADSIKMVQFMFGHSSEDITKEYIGAIDEKIDKYVEDYSNYLKDCNVGRAVSIDSSPVISIRYNDIRKILQQALASKNGENDIEIMNQLLSMVEEMRVS